MECSPGSGLPCAASTSPASRPAEGRSPASMPAGGVAAGPQGAGRGSGAACYGNGGLAATVTDANIVLGYLDAAAFMGGRRPLDAGASEAAVDRIAASLGLSRLEA